MKTLKSETVQTRWAAKIMKSSEKSQNKKRIPVMFPHDRNEILGWTKLS
ncbi:hypothetical protein [Methanolapillus africanus]